MLDTNINRILKNSTNIVKINRLIDNIISASSLSNAPAISDLAGTNPIIAGVVTLTFTKPPNTTVRSYKSTTSSSAGFSLIENDISSPSVVTGLNDAVNNWIKVTTKDSGGGFYTNTEINSNVISYSAV